MSRFRAEIPPDAGGILWLGGPVGCTGEAGVNCAFPSVIIYSGDSSQRRLGQGRP